MLYLILEEYLYLIWVLIWGLFIAWLMNLIYLIFLLKLVGINNYSRLVFLKFYHKIKISLSLTKTCTFFFIYIFFFSTIKFNEKYTTFIRRRMKGTTTYSILPLDIHCYPKKIKQIFFLLWKLFITKILT